MLTALVPGARRRALLRAAFLAARCLRLAEGRPAGAGAGASQGRGEEGLAPGGPLAHEPRRKRGGAELSSGEAHGAGKRRREGEADGAL
jgi:hypothetical protein